MGCNQSKMKPSSKDFIKESTILVDIPARLQWENHHGYCGQTAMQSIGLYFGCYLSQQKVRKVAGSQLLIGQNANQAIKKLGFQFQQWDNSKEKPQIKQHLQWIKKHLSKNHPVIITGYEPKGENDEYDHIYLAVGANTKSIQHYDDQDTLIYADFFDEQYTVTQFGKIFDDRSMSHNGKNLDFALPRNVNYGIAIKGIIDKQQQFLPVRVYLQQNSEPNVTQGQSPINFSINVEVTELQVGTDYVLLKYDDYRQLPKDHVYASKAKHVHKFKANHKSFTYQDEVNSNSTIFYRCIEAKDLQ